MNLNTNSEDWEFVKKWTAQKIAEMREKNDSDLDSEDTAKLRGRIEFAKELLELEETPEKPKKIDGPGYSY